MSICYNIAIMKNKLFGTYFMRFFIRIAVLAFGCILYFRSPDLLDIENFSFFSSFSITHIFWIFLLASLLFASFPNTNVSIGALKYRRKYYSPAMFDKNDFIEFKHKTNKKTIVIAIVWILFLTPFWTLYFFKIITSRELLILVLIFALADIFCILFFCPFQLFLGNKCCTTCRIFLWDHIFMLSPLIFVPGFFAKSLVIAAVIFLLIWEIQWNRHPEYFYEKSNANLRCSSCTGKLCLIKKPKGNIN